MGGSVAALASEVAGKKVGKVYAIENAKLEPYTPDAFVAALKQFIAPKQPKLVLMPHTYQVRDFVPKLATAMGRTVISDCHRLQERRRQAAVHAPDVPGQIRRRRQLRRRRAVVRRPSRTARFAETKWKREPARPRSKPSHVEIADGVVRNKPQEVFKEAKQAVDLTQAEIIVAVGRGIKEQKNIEIAKQLAEALGGELAASRPICDSGWLPMDRQIGSSGPDGRAETLSGAWASVAPSSTSSA